MSVSQSSVPRRTSHASNLFIALSLLASFATMVPAQVVVEKSAYATLTSLPPFSGNDAAMTANATKILTSDLDRSGWFKIVAPGSGEINIVGVANRSGSGHIIDAQIFTRPTGQGSGQMVYSGRFTGNSDAQLRQTVHALADDIVAKVARQTGIAQTRIAFISSRTGRKEVYTMDYDGHNIRQVTSDGSISARPRWSPDRSRIVYTSYKAKFPDIYTIELSSGRRSRIASYPGLNSGGAYSPAGGQIAAILSKDGNPELYVMSAGGGGLKRLTSTKGGESSPSWSPDGSRIVYAFDGYSGIPALCAIGLGGGQPQRLTTYGYYSEPDWSPKGGLIACVGRTGGRFQIFVFDPASPGGTLRQLTNDGADNEDPTWAPDDRHLVFTKSKRLYVLDVLTGSATNLGLNLGDCIEPAWSK